MAVAAIYARYSSDEQRETSITDQVRRCRSLAAQNGLEVDDRLIFSDAAVSGAASSLEKRGGYRSLMQAWDDGRFEVLITDEVSRLARDVLELAKLQVKVSDSGIRLLCADGVDSHHANWQLLFGIKSALGAHAREEIRYRVTRGMCGQLERGFMVGRPPFGYYSVKEYGESDKPLGTHWKVNDEQAAIIRDIYAQRRTGRTFAAIARSLNERGIPLGRAARNKRLGGYWRASRIATLLRNSIYRGAFTWNGSEATCTPEEKAKREAKPVEYVRPDLRIIDDETWFICNQGRISRSRRGGGRHLLAGLLTCGQCGATLEASERNRVVALHCPQCEQAYRVSALDKGPPYVSAAGVLALLTHIVEQCLSGELVTEFRNRLTALLNIDRRAEVDALAAELRKCDRTLDRLAKLIRDVGGEDKFLEREYRDARLQHDEVASRLRTAQEASRDELKRAAAAQLAVDPKDILAAFFAPALPTERTRALLHRLFPEIVLERKTARYVTHYRLTIDPGVMHAEASGTQQVVAMPVVVRYQVATSARRPVVWDITQLAR